MGRAVMGPKGKVRLLLKRKIMKKLFKRILKRIFRRAITKIKQERANRHAELVRKFCSNRPNQNAKVKK